MLTPTGVITIPQQTADGLWITNINIVAPSPMRPISAQIRVAPFNSQNGTLFGSLAKVVSIPDITGAALQYPSLEVAMSGMLQAAQDLISGKQLF